MDNIFNRERCEILGEYVINTGSTVRNAALRYGISKSTVHKDLSYKLRVVNPKMYEDVKRILDLNKSERHIRGGEATRQKYLRREGKSTSLLVQ